MTTATDAIRWKFRIQRIPMQLTVFILVFHRMVGDSITQIENGRITLIQRGMS